MKYLLRQKSRSTSLSKKRTKTMARSRPNTRASRSRASPETPPGKVTTKKVTKKVKKKGVMTRDDIATLKDDRLRRSKVWKGPKGTKETTTTRDEEVEVSNKPVGDVQTTRVDLSISKGADRTKGAKVATVTTVTTTNEESDVAA